MTTSQLFNQEAEQKMIALAITDPAKTAAVKLTPDDFYFEANRLVWAVIQNMMRAGEHVDFVTVTDQLKKQGDLGRAGGSVALSRYLDDPTWFYKADELSGIIQGYSRRRAAVRLASELATGAHDEKQDMDLVTLKVIDALTKLAEKQRGAEHWSEYFDDMLAEVRQRMESPQEIWGIPTGFADFDKITGGLQCRELMIMSGEPGVGKTIAAMQMGAQMSYHAPGAIYSIEMTGQAVARRLASGYSRVETRKMKKGHIDENDWRHITEAVEVLKKRPVYMSDAESWTIAGLRADLTRLRSLHGVKWFVVDYLYLIEDRGKDEIEKTQIISRGLKQIAKALDMAGIVIHSMNKEGMRAALPSQSDLRGSGQVSYDPDLIVFLNKFTPMSQNDKWIDQKEADNMRTLIFGKGRELETPQNYLHLVKKPGFPVFGDYAPELEKRTNGNRRLA